MQNNGEEKRVAALNIMKISLLCRSGKISNILRGLAADRRKDGEIGIVPLHDACPFGHQKSRSSIEYLYSLSLLVNRNWCMLLKVWVDVVSSDTQTKLQNHRMF